MFVFCMFNKKILNQDKTLIMGILNITPDSFSDGGLYFEDPRKALEQAEQMFREGVDIIDIGGESTRPGALPVSETEELERILPIVKQIREELGPDLSISVDTYKSKVAEECLKNGADMINSIGGFAFDSGLAEVAVRYESPIIIYHIKGEPRTMQIGSIEYKDVVQEIIDFFTAQIEFGLAKGIKKENFILDPGIGFGKELKHNLEIIERFSELRMFNLPLLIGVSRKSHLGMILQEELGLREVPSPIERVEAGLAEVAVAVLGGAKIVRTHDVLQTKKFLAVLDRLKDRK